MANEVFKLGSTQRLQITARKDGAVWDLTSATITLFLRRPDGKETEYSATASSPTSGIARYDAAASVLNKTGNWIRTWKIVDGSVTQYSEEIPFRIVRTVLP